MRNGIIVAICISYNSRYPRYLKRQPAPGNDATPAVGSAPEIVLKPGQIMVSDADQFMEYPAGLDGRVPTSREGAEAENRGFAILLLYRTLPK
jgi:hypothetical protein